ncbi:MAG: enoyl-CoA hydratase [Gammaproteobacteria bacterium BRH_c0]|nr:MAG: enoyl-CoA hydratase [Gammaproteobacteria bacterium BRH_c0]
MTQLVLSEQHGEVTLLTLNRPKARNAMSLDLILAMQVAFDQCMEDSSCRAIVVRGAEGHFCSGGDVSGMTNERSVAESRRRMEIFHHLARTIVAGPKPVIAAVEGFAAGAGFSLALNADYLVAATDAKFISSFAKVGLQPDMGMLWTLRQRVGLGQAKRIVATACKVEADEALALGLVDEVVANAELLERAITIAREFCANAPMPLAMMKRAYARGIHTFEDALRNEMDNSPALYLTKDHREAVVAFMEKRPPIFKGE